MKIVHFSNWAPRRSGLYECTRELVEYERKLGHISEMAIFETENPSDTMVDGDFKPVSWESTKDADIFVLHRGIPGKLEELKKPTVCVIHGTPAFLMQEEVISHAEKTPFNTHINLLKDCAATVAVNPLDYDIYKLYDGRNKLTMIHDAIDTAKYTIEGYQYPYSNHPQILFADSLRSNKYPSHIIWAMAEVVKRIPNARLTVVGLDLLGILTWRNLLLRSPGQHLNANIENLQFATNDNPQFMRGADILFNSNISGVPSRTELEAMACGCQVISYNGYITKYQARAFDIKDIADQICKCWDDIKDDLPQARLNARQWVLDNASAEAKAKEYVALYEKVLSESK